MAMQAAVGFAECDAVAGQPAEDGTYTDRARVRMIETR